MLLPTRIHVDSWPAPSRSKSQNSYITQPSRNHNLFTMANSKQRRNKAKALALGKSPVRPSALTTKTLKHPKHPKLTDSEAIEYHSQLSKNSSSTSPPQNLLNQHPLRSPLLVVLPQTTTIPPVNIPLKALVHLPYPNNNTKTVVTSSGYLPHLFIERHPFNSSPPDPTFKGLSRAIRDIFTMAKSRYQNKSNSNQLGGKMQMLGFCQASEKGISGGTYAYDQNLKKLDIANDLKLWDGLDAHNSFISGRVKSLYAWAYLDNTTLMKDKAIPNWSWKEWDDLEAKDGERVASCASVTWAGFLNKPHEDENDVNGWTYGMFSYIDKKTGQPIPPIFIFMGLV
ncbi:hypothetical protein MJO28_013736 [Puccinia striiformis f. sp. tritici]|uniref:Uncharacterized protein n=1 Tax=Puccinia striiformis f. sp. tritici TaxID=168172 RepID=A0ACC0DV63_9BASI|nr:hypothetical protein MJO28_013736 [Puccinia striiformis f. sp. tritici]